MSNDVSTAVQINIVDITAPVLTVPPNQVVKATGPGGAIVVFPSATATDPGSGVASVGCDASSGAIFPIGTTTVNCTATDNAGNASHGSFTVTVWDNPPVCTAASPSVSVLWPPNHQLVPITINGVTDPDGDKVAITITSIFQDEPLNSTGDGDTGIDGLGVGTGTAIVRAEREGDGDGRVYHISFSATDGALSCSGEVTVGVPHDQKKPIIDGGALFDSTGGGGGFSIPDNGLVPPPAFKD